MSKVVEVENLFGREILSYSQRYRNRLIHVARDHWRDTGFPYPKLATAEIKRELENLVASDRLVNERAGGLLSTVGLRVANASHPQIWHIKTRGKSCIDVFNDDDRLTRALSKAPGFWPGRRCWNAQSVRTLMRISHKMRPSNFRPVVARQLIRAFSNSRSCVLDFSAGFGGRLLGAVSLERQYIGIDPAHAQIAGLRHMYNRIRKYLPGSPELYQACAEDLLPELPSKFADLVISSPPYFDAERYSVEPSQSYLRYPERKDWIDSFLAPVLQHSARILRPSGVMLLNVTDRSDFNLKDIAIELSTGCLNFMGWIPYPMRANPATHMDGVLKAEPILVFQKPPLDLDPIHRKIHLFDGVCSTASPNT